MKKNIIIAVLILISASSMTYAYIKAGEANSAMIESEQLKTETQLLRDQAVEMQMMAQEAAAHARQAQAEAERAIQECMSK